MRLSRLHHLIVRHLTGWRLHYVRITQFGVGHQVRGPSSDCGATQPLPVQVIGPRGVGYVCPVLRSPIGGNVTGFAGAV